MNKNRNLQRTSTERQASLKVSEQSISKSFSCVEDAVACESKSIAAVDKEQGTNESTVKTVATRLIDTFVYLGAWDKADERTLNLQVVRLAESIVRKYYFLTISELNYFFQCFCDGDYGKLYVGHTINPQDIMIALQSYWLDVQCIRGCIEDRKRDERERIAKANSHPITYEEYCRMKGEDNPNLLTSLAEDKSVDNALRRTEIEKYKFKN